MTLLEMYLLANGGGGGIISEEKSEISFKFKENDGTTYKFILTINEENNPIIVMEE